MDPAAITTPDRRLMVGSLVVAAGGALLAIVPIMLDADMMTYGALLLLGPLIFFTGIWAAFLFRGRVRILTNMAAGEDLLANWSYEPAEWARFTEQEYRTEIRDRTTLLATVAVLMVVIWLVLLLVLPDKEAMVFVGYVLLAVFGLLLVVGFLVPWLQRRRNRRRPGAALLSPSGAWLSGAFHEWRSLGSQLESAGILDGDPAVIEIIYSQLTRYGPQDYTVRVPIPSGRMAEAERAVGKLQSRCGPTT